LAERRLTQDRKSKPMIWSEEGKTMQKQVWEEVYEVLVKVAPEVKEIVGR
jgi:hypothetical protein